MKVVRYAERPDLLDRRFEELVRPAFPAYMNENMPGNLYWDRLYADFPEFQVALIDGDELLAEAHAVPLPWDGTPEDLPSGWDEGFTRGMTSERSHSALMAISIAVAPAHQGRQLSSRMIRTFVDNARSAELTSGVLAPCDRPGRSATPSSRSRSTWGGGATTARTSIHGCGSTSSWAVRSSRLRRPRWSYAG